MLAAFAALAPLTAARAHAQERGTVAERGGIVALAAEGVRFDAAERARIFGLAAGAPERTGVRVVFQVDAEEHVDPLEQSALECKLIVIDSKQRFPGDTPAAPPEIERAAAIELVGGTWSQWWLTLSPQNRSSQLATLLREAHRRGTPIIGSGAAAGHLARYSLDARASIRPISRNAHPDDPDLALAGLGLVDGAFDSQAPSGGSLQRLARAALRTDLGPAVFLAGRGAWIVDARAGEAFLVGDGAGDATAAALVLDLGGPAASRRLRESVREARLSLVRPGVRWSLERRAPTGTTRSLPSGADPSATASNPARAVPDALGTDAVVEALDHLARSRFKPPPLDLRSPGRELVLTADERTCLAGDPARSIALVRCDILWEYPQAVR